MELFFKARLYLYIKVKFHLRTTLVIDVLRYRLVLTRSQRGALACIEFTGNIFGYAFSVVSPKGYVCAITVF